LRRGVRRSQGGVCLLQRLQLLKETVVLSVADDWCIEDVITVDVKIEQPAELGCSGSAGGAHPDDYTLFRRRIFRARHPRSRTAGLDNSDSQRCLSSIAASGSLC
jgi:hypothetical protein